MKRNPTPKIGDKFSKLTIINRAGKYKNGPLKWLCRCECGEKIVTTTTLLYNKKRTSCGCDEKKDISLRGVKAKVIKVWKKRAFSRWTVMITYECPECGKFEDVSLSVARDRKKVFCSRACYAKSMQGENYVEPDKGVKENVRLLRVLLTECGRAVAEERKNKEFYS